MESLHYDPMVADAAVVCRRICLLVGMKVEQCSTTGQIASQYYNS